MFKLAVFNLKDILKYLFYLVIGILTIYMVNRYFFSHKSGNRKINFIGLIEKSAVRFIDIEYPQISNFNQSTIENEITEDVDENYKEDFLTGLISSQISIAGNQLEGKKNKKNIKEVNLKENANEEESTEIQEDNIDNNNIQFQGEIENINTDIDTEIVTNNPLADSYTDMYGSVKIKNETSYTLSEDVLNPQELNIDSKNILIFHTHTCESYTSSDSYSYEPTGSYRTTDLAYTVARVGDELERYLNTYGFSVRHNKTYHDYPAYTGSYSRSLLTVQGILEDEKSDIIIDLHRDAIGSRPDYAPTVRIGDEYAAQIMFVMGSNGGGLYHPNWSSNLKFAVKIQEVANEMFPGLFKPIIFRNSRYNQHLGKAACIIEVGSTGNTLEQTLVSMKYLAAVLDKVLSN